MIGLFDTDIWEVIHSAACFVSTTRNTFWCNFTLFESVESSSGHVIFWHPFVLKVKLGQIRSNGHIRGHLPVVTSHKDVMLVLHCIQFTNYFDKWNFFRSNMAIIEYSLSHVRWNLKWSTISRDWDSNTRLVRTDRSFRTCTPRKLLLLFRFLGHHVDVFRTEQTCSKLKKVEHNLEHCRVLTMKDWEIKQFGEVKSSSNGAKPKLILKSQYV